MTIGLFGFNWFILGKIRPKSCIELSEKNNSDPRQYKIIRNEDSGNSSMSTSTPRSVRK